MQIKEVTTKEELKELYGCSAMTWEGLRTDKENLTQALECCCTDGVNGTIYLTKGKAMNQICKLKGDNAYPDELNIVSIKNYKGLAMQFGARWMDDIIDNNLRREHKTAKTLFK